MKKNNWLFLFIIALAANCALTGRAADIISKPVIILALIGYFLIFTRDSHAGLRAWILSGLVFSWLGDVLLMFVPDNDLFFLLGLSSFLLAHVFYIFFFQRIRHRESIPGNAWLFLPVIAYYVALMALLYPYLAEMKAPVILYGAVISGMLVLALHMLYLREKIAGRLIMVGAVWFIISDSVLAINKFYRPFDGAGLAIMLTYGIAQLFIVEGAARYINSLSKR